MKSFKFFRLIFMFFLTMGLSLSVYSCSEEDYEPDETVSPGDDSDSGIDDDQDDDSDDSGSRTECRYCNGSGDCPGSNCNNGKCIRCGGKGYTYVGKYQSTCLWCERGKCPVCNGRAKCPKCNGRGYN